MAAKPSLHLVQEKKRIILGDFTPEVQKRLLPENSLKPVSQ